MSRSCFRNIGLLILVSNFIGCGINVNGDYTGNVDGKEVSIKFENNGSVSILGYFPKELAGIWVEEKTFGDPQLWATFDGPKDKPFRLRFEFKPEGENFLLVGIKARPLGKGTKLNPLKIDGTPIFKPQFLSKP
jgi:hypothetical protein